MELNTTEDSVEAVCDRFLKSLIQLRPASSSFVLPGLSLENFDRLLVSIRELTEADLAMMSFEKWDTALKLTSTWLYEQAAAARQERNRWFSPFLKLPHEIAVMVLRASLPALGEETYFTNLTGLAQVCKSFLHLIHSTPLFWTFISDWMPEYAISDILGRCRGASLSVVCEAGFLQRLSTLPNPIRSLDLYLNEGHGADILFAPSPVLESLSMCSHNENLVLDTGELFSGHAEQLIEVELDSVSIQWRSNVLSGLEKLVISNIYKHPPTVEEILVMLSASPNLTHLELYSIAFAPQGIGQRRPTIRAHLPKLHILILRLLGLGSTEDLLSCIVSARSLSYISIIDDNSSLENIDPTSHSVGSIFIKESLIGLTEPMKELLARGDTVRLTVRPRFFSLEVSDGTKSLVSLAIKCPDSRPWLRWLIEVASEPLHIEVDAKAKKIISIAFGLPLSDNDGELVKKLDKLPITELIISVMDNTDFLLTHLGHPSGSHWPYRHLRALRIGSDFKKKHLEDMLHARYAGLQSSSPSSGSPVALHSLDFTADMPSRSTYVRHIRNIVERHGGTIDYHRDSTIDHDGPTYLYSDTDTETD